MDANDPLASVRATSYVTDANISAKTFLPTKIPSVAVVVQQFAQARARQSRTSFHGGLAK
jgi:hypothetical protein